MSLEIKLTRTHPTEVFGAVITHNVNEIASAAGVYKPIWRPEECGIKTAAEMIPHLRDGLAELKRDPERYRALEPENKFGTYDRFLAWTERYLAACVEYPDAEIQARR